eukprot:SAG31_NODE_4904_length_2876_cov_3.048614_4_plen_155_part_00
MLNGKWTGARTGAFVAVRVDSMSPSIEEDDAGAKSPSITDMSEYQADINGEYQADSNEIGLADEGAERQPVTLLARALHYFPTGDHEQDPGALKIEPGDLIRIVCANLSGAMRKLSLVKLVHALTSNSNCVRQHWQDGGLEVWLVSQIFPPKCC